MLPGKSELRPEIKILRHMILLFAVWRVQSGQDCQNSFCVPPFGFFRSRIFAFSNVSISELFIMNDSYSFVADFEISPVE